jgi:hypothetical protein
VKMVAPVSRESSLSRPFTLSFALAVLGREALEFAPGNTRLVDSRRWAHPVMNGKSIP